ncbi:MAG TPA: CocE/NonD family hydrolase [Solirubrobacteraceae bacterium]|nr:CocE/NonD family hydrolase [Solirubrobacteraceae bacterium]
MVAAFCLAAPAGALAAWEPVQPIDHQGGGFGEVTSHASREWPVNDVVSGASGLTTALFFHPKDGAYTQAYLARRAPDAASWGSPRSSALAPGDTEQAPYPVDLAANAAGDAIGGWRHLSQRGEAARWLASEPDPGPAVQFVGSSGAWPRVAIDDDGNAYAATVNSGSGTGDIVFSRLDRATNIWSTPTKIADGADVEIAVNGRGDVAVTYTRGDAGEQHAFVRRRLVGDADFSDEKPLIAPGGSNRSGVTGGGHEVAIDARGAITAVYLESPSGQPELGRAFARRWLPGAELGDVELLSTPRPVASPADDPSVVADPEGRVTAAWLQQESGNFYRVYSAERSGDQGFRHPERVSPANEHFTDDESSEPVTPSPDDERTVGNYDLAVDAEGTATIVYDDAPADSFGLTEDDNDVKATRRATGGRWISPVSLASDGAGAGAVRGKSSNGAAARARQADATFVQAIDGRQRLMATRFEGPPPSSGEHQTTVTSFDGTEILVQWCPAAADQLDPEGRAPTIIAGSGWGIPGRRCRGNEAEEGAEGVFGNPPIETFTAAGYNVLTFDARGFWRSGGTAQVDSPEVEARDMQRLIDYVAAQPEAITDAPGDPRVGMVGGSYGGGNQFVTAARDHRVEAIAPSIAWNSLVTSLFKHEAVKAGWAAILVGAGVPMTTLPGVLSPAGIQTGHMAQEVYDATQQGTTSGMIEPATRQWFAERGPNFLLDRIETPTLLLQGTVDTLFTLDEAHRNYEALAAGGTETKMIWFCGGHGACFTEPGSREHVNRRVLAWFDHHVRGRESVSTGPEFEWIDEGGGWNASERYPLGLTGELRGEGSGVLPLTPGEQGGGGVAATPQAGVEIPIETPQSKGLAAESIVLGEPQLSLTYTATGSSTIGVGSPSGPQPRTFVYAQIVDKSRNIVVNNLATPIPISLDGQQHELTLPLERIASRSTQAGYSLQIVPQTSVYDGQRAGGEVNLRSIKVTLPVDQPAAGGNGAGPGVTPASGTTGVTAPPETTSRGAAPCARASGFRSAAVRAHGTGLRFAFTPRAGRPPTRVELFEQTIGRFVGGRRRVDFGRRARPFAWNGRAGGLHDGHWSARLQVRSPGGALDTRLIGLQRRRGRWRVLPGYFRTAPCALVSYLSLARPVFGGSHRRPLWLGFTLRSAARVAITVSRGRRVLRLVAVGSRRAGTHRLVVPAHHFRPGSHTVTLTVTRAGRTTRHRLYTRRL